VPGAVLATSGMLLLVYALVRAPGAGWGSARTIAGLATAAALLVAFAAREMRSRNPLFPFSILRIKGLAAADATQLIAFAGFLSMFFFLTLYMQDVLGYSPIQAGAAYLPVTGGIIVSAGASSRLLTRIGTRPVIVAGVPHRRRPHPRTAHRGPPPRGRAHRRLPPGSPGRQHLPARRRAHRPPCRQHTRTGTRTRPRTGAHRGHGPIHSYL
jgi:uncharacterized membrane protein (UPF0136 family)